VIEVDSLETMAEIAIALTGFTGVVSVLGGRPSGGWIGPDRLWLQALLAWSLIAALGGVLPGILSSGIDSSAGVWFAASAVFAGVHSVSLSWILVSAYLRLGLSAFRLSERVIILVCSPLGALLLTAQIAVITGPLEAAASFIYHAGIAWYLLISGIAFSFMLFPRPTRTA